jgi:stress-induced morphogen
MGDEGGRVMASATKLTDTVVSRIRDILETKYLPKHPRAVIDVYRHNSSSVRVRILDPDFARKDVTAREKMVWPVLETLPDNTLSDLAILLLLPPEDRESSLLSLEFDAPSRSRL